MCKRIGKIVVGCELRVVKKSEVVAGKETVTRGTAFCVYNKATPWQR